MKQFTALAVCALGFCFLFAACTGTEASGSTPAGGDTLPQVNNNSTASSGISNAAIPAGDKSNTEESHFAIPFTKEEAQKKYIDPLWLNKWMQDVVQTEDEKEFKVKTSDLTANDLMRIYLADDFLEAQSDDPSTRAPWITLDETTGTYYVEANVVEQYIDERFGVEKEVMRQGTDCPYDADKNCYVIPTDGFGGALVSAEIVDMKKGGEQILIYCVDSFSWDSSPLWGYTVILEPKGDHYVIVSWCGSNEGK